MPNNNGWISVKDRLPTESGSYLVCGYDMKDDRKLVVTTRKWINSMFSFYGDISVIAWMPLPEPYDANAEAEEPQWQQYMMDRFLKGE